MKATLCALTALLAVYASGADQPPKKKKKTFAEVACAQDGPGVLVRYHARDAADVGAFDGDMHSFGVEPFGPQPPAEPDGVVPKSGPKAPKARTYRVLGGQGCEKSLASLGERGDRVELAPGLSGDDTGTLEERIEASFNRGALYSQLSHVEFADESQLAALWDNLKGRKGTFQELVSKVPGVSLVGNTGDAVMTAPPGYVKRNPAGDAANLYRPHVRMAPPTDVPAAQPVEQPESWLGWGTRHLDNAFNGPRRGSDDEDTGHEEPTGMIGRAVRRLDDAAHGAHAMPGQDLAACAAQRGSRQACEHVPDLAAGVDKRGLGTPTSEWMRMPNSGPGFKFVRYGQWGTPEMITGLVASFKDVADKGVMEVGDISKYGGGKLRHHLSHRKGVDADIFFAGGTEGFNSNDNADHNLKFLIQADRHMKITMIFLSDRRKARLWQEAHKFTGADRASIDHLFGPQGKGGAIRFWPGHDNHFHIRIQ